QAILRPWLRTDLSEYLFQPREAVAERRASQRGARKTKVQPSQRDRRKGTPKKLPRERDDAARYRRAIVTPTGKGDTQRRERGEAEIPPWHPHQLRHSAGPRIRPEFGLDAARACLGHSTPVTTEIYAELDRLKAVEVMEKIG